MNDIEAELERCPILRDKAKDLSLDEIKKLRENYEKYIKPYFPANKGAKTEPQKAKEPASRPRHQRLKKLRENADKSGCPFLNSSMLLLKINLALNEPREDTFEFGYKYIIR
eukprot:TRINITY_DN162_c0_g1_i22.p4 TRINITY_DN162_c0_g1~~TRINITY_DN162_c0_g1_i22.p4  ORF type:complete len:112 (-),score=26.94 TRINITY_DN162_c0_g1_i22:1530-1865(-)